MAQSQTIVPLCSSCRGLTFAMLRDGYTHHMPFRQTVISGKTCRMCRLIVCSVAKLHIEDHSYGLDAKYESEAEKLSYLPAVHREKYAFGFPIMERMQTLSDIVWDRSQHGAESEHCYQVRKGNFNQGETVQVTAPSTSIYYTRKLIPVRDIEPGATPDNVALLKNWLNACISGHPRCHRLFSEGFNEAVNDKPILPTRVIDVGSPTAAGTHPRLLTTLGMKSNYITLSHRWGLKPRLKTMRANIERFQRRIPLEEAPATFKDAIEVVRQLGFQYLWIDSLCIVQDNPLDWDEESRRMGDIFESSTCTIAAVDSLDDDDTDNGLFLSRNPDPLAVEFCLPYHKEPLIELSRRLFPNERQVFVWKYYWLKRRSSDLCKENPDLYKVAVRPRIRSLWKSIPETTWHNRGWVLQERTLSRRMIYYTKAKLYWSCFETTGDEQQVEPTAPVRISWRSINPERLGSFWQDLLSDYSRCSLSKPKDRLAAIEGIRCKLETRLSSNIHAGVLDDGAGLNLLWYTNKVPLSRFDDFHAPSWTWASLRGSVAFSLKPPRYGLATCIIRDISYEIREQCTSNRPKAECAGTCLSGQVSFTSPLGVLRRTRKFVEVRDEINCHNSTNRQWLPTVLGSAAVRPPAIIQRLDQNGNIIPRSQESFVPNHTELLSDEYRQVLGFMIPDEDIVDGPDTSIYCAGIRAWLPSEHQNGGLGTTNPTGMTEIDILCLEKIGSATPLYRQVGLGRIICNDWLDTCKQAAIRIV
ncbi:heterokaryon incompatibility protein-domain-containing protein [Pseudomassariella vexata]|uniref:Heterokaryon incompatibility protein-domain-containing protein n=1 Tax=Pseudomassariella vexata TaxID=1141098 RepID=A0A1Y2DNQ3_9PEZI|nr:heterokaryon incompatibility protein-domain-containing protein [Pseudomassariella vexata]ORY60766.1 heterokaryon incompatibility protein-domain-containing protein [Pseudomassariella vexata]